jgi:signal transduction histidine kinase
LSFLLSSSLQRIVARPIASLADTATEIAARGDYSIRATRTSQDEIGVLVDAFNGMLDEIEASERERADLLEREQQANRLKDEFLATVSHELRTPSTRSLLGAPAARRQLPEEERTHALERINQRTRAAFARLVQDLLDVSRITTGKLRLDVREMDFATVVATPSTPAPPLRLARSRS